MTTGAKEIPEGFLLHEKEAAVSERTGAPLLVSPCAYSDGRPGGSTAGGADRLDARTVYSARAEQVILYSSATAARLALQTFRAEVGRCGKKKTFRRGLTEIWLGDEGWKSTGRTYGKGRAGQEDNVVIVRRANALVTYLRAGTGPAKPRALRGLIADAAEMQAKICDIAECVTG